MADPKPKSPPAPAPKGAPAAAPKKAPRYRVRVITPEGFTLVSKPVTARLPVPLPPIEGELPAWKPPPPLEPLPAPDGSTAPPPPGPPPETPAPAAEVEVAFALQDDAGNPRAGLAWTLTFAGGTLSGKTGADGSLAARLPAGTTSAKLSLSAAGGKEEYELQLGLEPASSVKGVQQRLASLGYACGATGEVDEETLAALRAFRHDQGLPPGAGPDEATGKRLDEVYSQGE